MGGFFRKTRYDILLGRPGKKIPYIDYRYQLIDPVTRQVNRLQLILDNMGPVEDPHRATAAAMFNKPPYEVTSQERGAGKSRNFMRMYGARV